MKISTIWLGGCKSSAVLLDNWHCALRLQLDEEFMTTAEACFHSIDFTNINFNIFVFGTIVYFHTCSVRRAQTFSININSAENDFSWYLINSKQKKFQLWHYHFISLWFLRFKSSINLSSSGSWRLFHFFTLKKLSDEIKISLSSWSS